MMAAAFQRSEWVQSSRDPLGRKKTTRALTSPWQCAIKTARSLILALVQEQRGWTNMTRVAWPLTRGMVVAAGQAAGGVGSGFGVLLYFQSIPVPTPTTASQNTLAAIQIR